MENLRGEQSLHRWEAMPEPRMLPPEQAQKHRICNGEPELWVSSLPTYSYARLPHAPIYTSQNNRICYGESKP